MTNCQLQTSYDMSYYKLTISRKILCKFGPRSTIYAAHALNGTGPTDEISLERNLNINFPQN